MFSQRDGRKSFEGHSVDGISQGLQPGWWENGQKMYEHNRLNGEFEGLYQACYQNGQKRYESIALGGLRMGASTEWHENRERSLQLEGITRENQMGSLLQLWDELGTLTERVTYDEHGQVEAWEKWDRDGSSFRR